ncbi:GPI ethanolamine phosphate transferase 2 isoform X7 [Durio zibethinus]|uniref:GPI ethanolamine phosphate transferase 2 isoform X7 n=1 Tax=Durio zibethinus TaxID=66656 RepID=A0A6P5YFQ0_DURZI|nr:GPI ethanolamine phosphate transferase 2 isoform X7 [Durio zibethinus]
MFPNPKSLKMPPLTCTKLALIAITGVIIQIIGLSLFVFGFFPVKPALPGISGSESYHLPVCDLVGNQSGTTLPSDQLRSLYQELSGMPPLFDRLILMVIDGLPAEFVLGKNGKPPSKQFKEAMPYTQSLLASGLAIGYHAKAAPPTVTMPRLKAMVSGAIGGFLDVAFNFNTQAMLDDNLLGQFFRIGWKMVMLGDETWLKLFPGLFKRHDGVSSFYVKDTVQVDQNVSRHLGDELSRDDWNLLILHYLGLDHVGHIGGRSSVLMVPKLKEMDDMVKLIHSSTTLSQGNDQGRMLLMIVSDHGMTENGNHGGSSYEETDSLALFIGLRNHVLDYASVIQQIDIAPTLALLFGVPIPKNNVGVLIKEAFDSLKEEQHLRALELNSWQLLGLLQAQLSGLPCRNFPCDAFSDHQIAGTSECYHRTEDMLCCLYMEAAALYSSWKSKRGTESASNKDYSSTAAAYYKFLKSAKKFPFVELRDSLYVIGWAYILCWCLLQLLLQQPINSTPILLLLVQILASMLYFASNGTHHKEWIEIAALYYLGMAGHFALGNSNTLATIDVAGAFIGLSSHSTLLSGILMFIITYASPMFILLSLVMYISMKNMAHLVIPEKADAGDLLMMMIGFPCLVPLVVNSILLTAYTVVLLLMRNHLFVWSVFSPKYLYVCATTLCTYIGVFIVAATGTYTHLVLAMRRRKQVPITNNTR